ncbi:sulfite exporter TauE/SafE family protein [Noviherbaspirillum saxi]|uniref:Probable membrane transporter protein n=1 Tax=Noviherbaspirillum saxi TaxID=2320863 RepID=A0A3A3FHP4_9BURK|nr:sulfite exporter TauE/SafE family protein [Noviherbaspirillum saxi]RJF92024.1 sulfite exporter TauE/SafE family protein [Noviherbaspirillum saxi]
MDITILIVILGAVVAGFVQGLSGFAFGLVAMSFWAWAIDPRLAAAMAVFGGLTGQIVAVFTVRRRMDLKLLLPFILGGLVGIPIGVGILPHLNIQLFKATLGTILVVWCPIMLFAHRLRRIEAGGSLANGIVGVLGGMMGGLGGFSGTIPTLWCTLKRFDKSEQRSVIQNFNLAVLFVTMLIYVSTGVVNADMIPMFVIVGPAMLIPSLLGARLYIGMSETNFRKLVLGLLTASGIALLASSLPKLIGDFSG